MAPTQQGSRLAMPRSKKKAPKTSPKKTAPFTASEKRTVLDAKPQRSEPNPGPDHAKAPGYAIGDPVSHPQFGAGDVIGVEGEKLTIKFGDGRVKQIVDYYVKRRQP
jgi:hypothetical protein